MFFMSMAATAEVLQDYERLEYIPRVVNIAEMPEDRLVRARAERFIRGVGKSALKTVDIEPVQEVESSPQINSLHEAIHGAAWGDENARNLVTKNFYTDVVERIYKKGNITKTDLNINEDGEIVQFGQSMQSVYENSLIYASATPKIRQRSEAEARNGFRLQQAIQQDVLDDHYFVVISRCADDMTESELKENGFFADSKTTVIQATTKDQDGLAMASAFVAGVRSTGQERHDGVTIEAMADELGVDYGGKSSVQIIDEPLLIHKSLMPNGVADLVKLYDKHAGGTFFGEDRPVQDYQEYEKYCQSREDNLAPTVNSIVNQLIVEAADIQSPIDAVKRVNELSGQTLVRHAIKVDKTIDPMVFGEISAVHINEAREYAAHGHHELARDAENLAQNTQKSSSCASALEKANSSNSIASNTIGGEGSLGTEKDEAGLAASSNIRCINCRKNVKKAEVVKKDCWECPSCQHKVDICTGKVLVAGKK